MVNQLFNECPCHPMRVQQTTPMYAKTSIFAQKNHTYDDLNKVVQKAHVREQVVQLNIVELLEGQLPQTKPPHISQITPSVVQRQKCCCDCRINHWFTNFINISKKMRMAMQAH
ncbi:hypothetical protein KP509_12G031500 [Ceratopteris richardii]|uniref:Uncharacterized protein n=1 Tax=Ceratopteris richardii TaxID=49495 RepID=A0A8T2TQT4_CERRI|nr:hypothetical protein KP509_12G031500 [Ceratopteris richardii]